MSATATIVTTSREALVFRDGKPFGMEGALTGGKMPWPMPSTLAGMIRSRIGISRSTAEVDYFARGTSKAQTTQRDANLRALLDVSIRSLPVHRPLGSGYDWNFLSPAPADAAIYARGSHRCPKLEVRRFQCEAISADQGEGCADLWSNWRLPMSPSMKKPASAPTRPLFWHENTFHAWLKEEVDRDEYKPAHLGILGGTPETRIHTAIDPTTGMVVEGALFDAPGVRLGLPTADKQPPGELGLAMFIDGLKEGDNVTGAVHLHRIRFAA